MTSHLSNLLESFSCRNHTCILGTPDFTDSSSEHFLEKNKQNKKNKILQFFFLGTSACSPNLVHSLHAVICAKQHCCVELWEISESEDNSKMLHCQETSTGLLMVHL